jgi:hypothetical protein
MNLERGKLRKFKSSIRDLCDQELAIKSRRKQLFDLLAAECGSDKQAIRTARVIYYELQKEIMRKARLAGMEFMDNELGGDRREEYGDEDFDATEES